MPARLAYEQAAPSTEGSHYTVIDAVGNSSFGRCRRLLNPHGIYASTDLGPLSQNPVLAARHSAVRRQAGPVLARDPAGPGKGQGPRPSAQ
jgi:hypothetical protein